MKKQFWNKCRSLGFIVVTLVFISIPAFSQKLSRERLDSLEAALSRMKEDTLKVGALNDVAINYQSLDPDKGIRYGNEALVLCRKIAWKKGESITFRTMGKIYQVQQNYMEALNYYTFSLKIAEEIGDSRRIGLNYMSMGVVYMDLGEYVKAMDFFSRSLKILDELGDEAKVTDVLGCMGNIYAFVGDYAKSLEYYLRTLKAYEKLGAAQSVAGILTNIGTIYSRIKDYPKALEYYAKALKIQKETDDKYQIAVNFQNTGTVFEFQGKYNEALEHYLHAKNIYDSLGHKSGIASSMENIGSNYIHQGDFGLAMSYLLKALKINEELGEKEHLYVTLGDIGKCYLEQKNFAEAEKYYLAALKIAEEIRSLNGIMDLSDNITRLYTEKRDFKNALEFHKKFVAAKDSLQNEENIKKITRLEMQYEFDKKEDSIRTAHQLSEAKTAALLTSETNLRKVYVASSLVVLLLLILAGTLYQYRSQKKKMALIKQVNEVEMKALRAQMNPHFMFNTLNSIYNFVRLNDNKSALDFLSRFSRLMRLTLENSINPSITLKEELEALELYLMLESRRLDNKFNYVINVKGELEPAGILVPPLLLQPYVENAIWHGMRDIESGGWIEISIEKEGELLKYTVTDNGPGFSESNTETHGNGKSYGGLLTEQRVQILNKTKNSNGYVRVYDRTNQGKSGVKVELAIPLENA